MMTTVNAKIVIIGCGISGITAAQRLVKARFHHVRILEATARSGGRIKTGRFGERLFEATSNNLICIFIVSAVTGFLSFYLFP